MRGFAAISNMRIDALTRVKRFAHRSEHGLKPSRLRIATRSQGRVARFALIETQQVTHRHHDGDQAKLPIVAVAWKSNPIIMSQGPAKPSKPALQLIAGDERFGHNMPFPKRRSSSANASNPGRIATEGWPGIARFTSSKSSACAAAPLISAGGRSGQAPMMIEDGRTFPAALLT